MGLVPGRQCGGCSVCCKVLPIDTAEIQKQAGVSCLHCAREGGCTIYETRPQICRAYYCGWMTMHDLGEDWRPDKSGVFISAPGAAIPAHFENRNGLELLIGSPRVLEQKPFVDLVCILVAKRIPVFLAIPGPVAHFPANILLNDDLADPVSRKDEAAIAAILSAMLEELSRCTFAPVPMPPRSEQN
ncbi:MAG: hypothetical protein WCA81_18470 [Rhizomicrobium sp.]